MHRKARRIDTRKISSIPANRRSEERYSSVQLRQGLAGVAMRISPKRRVAALAPLVLALIAWFVVPSYAAYVNPDARHEGLPGGSGRCVWDGSAYRCPGSSYLAYGYFQLKSNSGGPTVDAYCMDLNKDHFTGDILDDKYAADPAIAYIVNRYYPAEDGYAGELSHADEAAAVQLAVWGVTDDALSAAHPPKGTWPAGVLERAHDMLDAGRSIGPNWVKAQGDPTISLSVTGSPATTGGDVTVSADVKDSSGAAWDRPGKVEFKLDGAVVAGTLNPDVTTGLSGGKASITIRRNIAGSANITATLLDAVTVEGRVLVPANANDQRMAFPRAVPRSPSTKGTAAWNAAPQVVTPTVTTQASKQTAMVGDSIHDTVVVSGSANEQTTATVKLWGPYANTPTASDCTGTPAWTGTIAVNGDNTYTSADFTVTQAGYYTYQETMPGDSTHNAVTTPCAVSSETTLVNTKITPTVTTQASAQTAMVGDKIHDSVVVSGMNGQSATATVDLFGPFAATPTATDCTGTPAWTGTVAVHGDNTYTTGDFTIAQPGYYTYQETLPGDTGRNAVTTPCAVSAETTLANTKTTPNVTTQASTQSASVGDKIHDTVVLSGSNGYKGTVTVNLYGPFTSAPTSTSCTGTPAWTGRVAVNGDSSYVTDDFMITNAGYYTYQETLPGDTTHNAVTTPCGVTQETTHASPVQQVQGVTTSQVAGLVSVPETGAGGTGLVRTTIVGLCMVISGLILLTGMRFSPHNRQ